MKSLAFALALSLVTSVSAQAQTSTVQRLTMALDLFDYGLAQADPVLVLSAAKITAAVYVKDVTRQVETRPGATPAQDSADPSDPQIVSAKDMFSIAYELAEGDPYLQGMIEDAASEGSRGQVGGASRTLNRLQAGYVDMVRIEFEGGTLAELAILGDDGANLDLRIVDAKGKTICAEQGNSDKLYCAWTPAEDGVFFAEIENVSGSRNSYYVLTN
ncbi:hypothetical protein [Thalassovita sp.]|uniref:hypothetical protein n=1 Tax=Thalassovita sp. TaxID=1979401 RepID=UPI0028816B6C|nr:hypothetical protein [Thalassovita sp.]MDF1803364.1 hypothetical protein [Thalassovita sp.]